MTITDTTQSTIPSAAANDASATDATDDGWREAGAAWAHQALDWAYLFEPYARDAIETVFDRISLAGGQRLVDVACGSGYAMAIADRRGVDVTGLDASEGLLEIARRRVPNAQIDAGTMFALPYENDTFDVATSFNGIWGGCEKALDEIHRVLKPGSMLGVTFWGPGKALDFRDMFMALGGSTVDIKDEMIGLASIGSPGVAEAMMDGAGFDIIERGGTTSVLEFCDAEHAWRAIRSPGLVQPALSALGDKELRAVLMPTLEPFRSPDGSYRLRNELTHVVARARG